MLDDQGHEQDQADEDQQDDAECDTHALVQQYAEEIRERSLIPFIEPLRSWNTPAVRWFFAAVFFHILAHIFIYVFFSLYLDSLGYSKLMIGVLWAVSVVVEILGFYTQSRWLHHPPAR